MTRSDFKVNHQHFSKASICLYYTLGLDIQNFQQFLIWLYVLPQLNCLISHKTAKKFCGNEEFVVIGGLTPSSGNVLVRGRPVCDDGWGQNEADVVCRFVFNSSFSVKSRTQEYDCINIH